MTGELRALLSCLLVDSALAPVRCVGRLARVPSSTCFPRSRPRVLFVLSSQHALTLYISILDTPLQPVLYLHRSRSALARAARSGFAVYHRLVHWRELRASSPRSLATRGSTALLTSRTVSHPMLLLVAAPHACDSRYPPARTPSARVIRLVTPSVTRAVHMPVHIPGSGRPRRTRVVSCRSASFRRRGLYDSPCSRS